ncbi:MAG: YgfZ/GcvT domain-containing protein [Acidimicrobiales bacterium]
MSPAAPDGALAEDYAALRQGWAARRVERDAVALAGPDAADYLQGQCSQDVAALGVGETADTLLLEPDGKLTALVRVVRTAGDRFVLDTDHGYRAAVAARLARFRLRAKVEIEEVPADEWGCVALRGPLVPRLHEVDGAWVVVFDWNGVTGVDLLGPVADTAAPAETRWCGAAAWEALRVEAGIPAMGRELDERTIAPEAGLVGRTVSFTKGCYTGQELIARLDARGNKVARRLCGVVLTGPESASPGGLDGAALVAVDGREVGRVTSSAWCPGLSAPAGLAYLHRSVLVPGPVRVVTGAVLPGAGPFGEAPALEAEARPLPLVV